MSDQDVSSNKADPTQTTAVKELAHDRPLLCCRYDPSGKSIAAGSHDHNVVRWDLTTDTKTTLAAHDTWVNAIAFSRDGTILFSAACDGRLIWWENSNLTTQPMRSIEAHQGWVRAIDISPDGTLVATGGNDNRVRIFRVDDGNLLAEFAGHDLHVYSVLFHPNGEFLLSGDLLGAVCQWDISSGKQVRTFDAKKLDNYNSGQRVHYGGVRSLALSLDGTQLATGGLHKATNPLGNVQEPLVVLFDWESGDEVQTLEIGETKPLSVSRLLYHPAKFLMAATRYNEGFLLFWRGEEKTVFHKHKVAGGALDFDLHADGLRVATAHHDGKIRVSRMSS